MSHVNCVRAMLGLTILLCGMTGCQASYYCYTTPGDGADLSLFADEDIQTILERKPAAPFPAHLTIARVQAPRYRSYTAEGYGYGRFSIVTIRDVESEEDYTRIAALPQIVQVAGLNRLLLGEELKSDRDLRQAAATLHADLLMVYTLDTDFFVGDNLRPLTVISLGLSPNKKVRVATTAAAVLIDVRTGYVYGACETISRTEQLASAWTSDDAVDQSRLKTERQAFEDLLADFEKLLNTVAPQRNASSGAET